MHVRGLFAQWSGLGRLIDRYACPEGAFPRQAAFRRATVQFGPVRYRSCVDVASGPEGLYLWVRPPLNPHPPLLIPWSEVQAVRPARLYWLGAVRLSVGREGLATVAFYRSMFEGMRPHLPPSLCDPA